MQPTRRTTARSAWLHRLWTRGPSGVSVDGLTLRVEQRAGTAPEIPVGSVDAVEVPRSWFWHSLTIRAADGARHAVGGLDEQPARAVLRAAREAAAGRAATIGPQLLRVDEQLRGLLAGDRYARRSEAGTLHGALSAVVRECPGAFARQYLPPPAGAVLGRLAPLEPPAAFEAARERANDRFAAERVPAVQAAARTALRVPLTDEQALAIATDEDATLVLAGAGTGKTAVIIGKVAHLVRNEGVPGFPHAEERRLFYVAMTRARRGAYLVTDPQLPSPFVTELRRDVADLRQLGELPGDDAPECPRCLRGKLVASQSGRNLRCSNHPMCRQLAPRCGSCNAGYAIATRRPSTCTNASCNRPPTACPTCGVGVLVGRYGRYGRFLGCSEFTSDPPCTHTENIPRRSARTRA